MSLARAERYLRRAKARGWSEVIVPEPRPPKTPYVVGLTDGTTTVQHGATTREDALTGALKKAGFL